MFKTGLIRHSATFTGIEAKTQTPLQEASVTQCLEECMTQETCVIGSLHMSTNMCYTSDSWMGYSFAYDPNNPFAIRKGNFSNINIV